MSQKKHFRHEYKYLITPYEYYILLARLTPLMSKDPNSHTDGGYHIRSLYFDDMYDSSLMEKGAGVYRREKFRIRIYDKSDKLIKLERKSKWGNHIEKQAASLSLDEYQAIINDDTRFLAKSRHPLKKLFYSRISQNLLKPVVITDYMRDALIYPLSEVRVTFDKKVSTVSGSLDIFDFDSHIEIPSEYYNRIVLEVKFNNFLPDLIRDRLHVKASNEAVSKYVLCRMALEKYNLKGC